MLSDLAISFSPFFLSRSLFQHKYYTLRNGIGHVQLSSYAKQPANVVHKNYSKSRKHALHGNSVASWCIEKQVKAKRESNGSTD